jgi:transcriptional regulator with GAF, ATPase, and Fis domain
MNNPDRIPMGILAPKPKVPVPFRPPETTKMSREYMVSLLEAGMDSIVQSEIEKFSLPLRIDGKRIMDSLEGTDLALTKFKTCTPSCLEMKEDIVKMAKSSHAVLITGQTGTGKEIIARAMVGARTGAFAPVNCGGLPEHLVESELFGHERGAFTGAEGTKQGMCQFAKDGVLFLDEIGELPLSAQAKFLRAIQDMRVRRVGANKEEDINCKFVCATNRNLKDMVKAGTFKEDLYARISTLEVHIPSLSERPDDIEMLILNEPGGDKFLAALIAQGLRIKDINLSFNVRSIQKCVVRFNTLGRIILS